MPFFLVQNIIYKGYCVPPSYHTNFYSKILNWVNRFVQARFLNNISQSYSVAHWQSVCFSPRGSPVQILRLENSGKRKKVLQSVYSESKGPTGRSQIFQMLSDSPIAYSLEPTTALAFRGGPNIRATWPTSRSLLLKCESNLIYKVKPSFQSCIWNFLTSKFLGQVQYDVTIYIECSFLIWFLCQNQLFTSGIS